MKKNTLFKIVSLYFVLALTFAPITTFAIVGVGSSNTSSVPGASSGNTTFMPVSNSVTGNAAPGAGVGSGASNSGPSFGDSLKTSVTTGLQNGANSAVNAAGGAGAGVGSAVSDAAGGGAVGGAAGACASSVVSAVAISGTIAALTAAFGFLGVPSFNPDTGLAGAFTSGTSFLDFLKVNCLDPAARAIYAKMLFKINDSVLKWGTTANKGGLLNGSTFISDVGSYFNAVAEESVGTFIAREDKTNPFNTAIVKSIYTNARSSSDSSYTPDLSERVLAAACEGYIRQQSAQAQRNSTTNSGGILNSIRNFFNPGAGALPESSKPYTPPTDNAFAGQRAFRYISPKIAYAEATPVINVDGSVFGAANEDTSLTVAGQVVPTTQNPCTRKATTAAEKQAVMDEYRNGNFNSLLNQRSSFFDLVISDTQLNNNQVFAVSLANNAKDQFAAQTADNERVALTGSNNTGVRRCIPGREVTNPVTGEKTCPIDGYTTTVTPQVVNSQTQTAHMTSNEILQKLASTGTWKDLAQTIVTNLVTNLSNQLINSSTGLLSFNGQSSGSSQGSFTQSVNQLNQAGTSVAELNTSASKTQDYVTLLKSDSEAIGTLVDKVTDVKNTCTELLSVYSKTYTIRGLEVTGGQSIIQNHECNIDQANLNYKDDPTAAIRLANNPIYIEVSQLDTLKQQQSQVNQVYSNAQSTLNILQKTSSTYANSQDVNREINLSTQTSLVLGQVPQEADFTQKQTQLTDIQNRIARMDTVLARIKQELATAKNNTSSTQTTSGQ